MMIKFLLDNRRITFYHKLMKNKKSPHLLFRKLLEIMDDLRRESIKAIKESDKAKMYNLTVRQGSAISQLKLMMEEEPQGVSLKALAKRMQMTIPASSLMVEALVNKQYVQRIPNPDDRRSVLISLTESGIELFNSVYARFHAELDRRAESLTGEELAAFASLVRKMEA